MSLLSKVFGDTNARVVKGYDAKVQEISALEPRVTALDDAALKARVAALRDDAGKAPDTLDTHLVEMFALTREAARRAIGQRHYDVQLVGGMVLHEGRIAEMRTGEGKTLVATLPLALNALTGRGVHLVTVNDYLAKRDAGWMGSVYDTLGLTCAAIVHEEAFRFDRSYENELSADPLLRHLRPVSRAEAYAADITYGTNNEFGFDYLRDNMVPETTHLVQRPLYYAIVDEVDSILIDEARTPLIISAPVERSANEYRHVDAHVKQLSEGRDFKVDEKLRSVFLTDEGTVALEHMLNVKNLYATGGDLLNIVNQALKANSRLFERDKQYVVKDGEIIIVDEFTGRLMQGRRYSEGLHQAIEAKEGVEVKQESQTLATITFQNLFRMYDKLAGMTGTAATEAEEFHKIYELDVVTVPTHRPMIRKDAEDLVYKNEEGKYLAVVREIKQRYERGQPVLVGTISIAKNEVLSALLEREGVPHQILNAKNHEREAAIIAQAGRKGSVTIATNMAGRGVDIILGGNPPNPDEQRAVKDAGGLHVIGTERHESRRIDLQLRGRSGRQGDPGSSQFFLSMEDDLMRIFGSERMQSLMTRLGVPDDMPIQNGMVTRSIESAQKKVEGHNFDIRKHLVEYDDVMNKHREVIYRKRKDVLNASADVLRDMADGIIAQEVETIVSFHTAGESESQWKLDEMYDAIGMLFPVAAADRKPLASIISGGSESLAAREAIVAHLTNLVEKEFASLLASMRDPSSLPGILQSIILRSIDTLWIEHLDLMERLREGIGLRGYGQREPLVEYKKEAFQLFTQLINSINLQIAASVFKIRELSAPERSPMSTTHQIESAPAKTMDTTPSDTRASATPTSSGDHATVGRNDPCPCGSGKKYKKCYLAADSNCKLKGAHR